MSCLGALRLQRQWWGSRCGCAAVGYGVDEVLGVDGHYPRALQQHLSRLAADVSFAKAQEHLTALLPVNLSKEALRREDAAEALGKLGPAAKPAVEALMECFKDENDNVRQASGVSLKAIDPTAARKAGVP